MVSINQDRQYYYPEKGEKPPEGVKTYLGPKGGRYYFVSPDESTSKEIKVNVNSVESLKPTIEKFKQKISEVIENLPEWHTENINFYLTTKDDLKSIKNGKDEYISGQYESASDVITVSTFANEWSEKDLQVQYQNKIIISPKSAYKIVALHEIGHRVSYHPKVLQNYFAEIVKKEGSKSVLDKPYSSCTLYGFTDYKERFAEGYLFYLQNPQHLMKTDPDLYTFLKDKVFEGKEYGDAIVKQEINNNNLPLGSRWINDSDYAKKYLDKKSIKKEVDSFIEKALSPFKSYIPVRTIIHKKDGTIESAIRWKSFNQDKMIKVSPTKPLSAVQSLSQTPNFTRFSSIRQTLFLLVDDYMLNEIKSNNYIPMINYEFLGEGIYLYSDLDIAKERSIELNKEILPVKINVNRIYNTNFDIIRLENIETIKTQGFEAILLIRNKPYVFDIFCLDNRDVIVIGDEQLDEEFKKSIDEYESDEERILLSKEDLDILECQVPENLDSEEHIEKASTISTPYKEDGTVDYDKVPNGASIWVTVTKEGSPLHGRPIIITKRPDGLFAITGGAGFSQIKTDKGMRSKIDAFRHLVMGGKPKRSQRDIELDKIQEENEKLNEPLIQKRQELMREGREQITVALNKFNEALNIKEQDKAAIRKHREELREYALEHHLDENTANDFANTFIKHHSRTERQIEEKRRVEAGLRISKLRRMKDSITQADLDDLNASLQFRSMKIAVPQPESFSGLSKEEIDLKLGSMFDEKLNEVINPNPLDETIDEELKEMGINLDNSERKEDIKELEICSNIKPLEIKDTDTLNEAFNVYKEYYSTKKAVNEVSDKIKPAKMSKVTPAVVEQMKLDIKEALNKDVSDEDVENYQRNYEEQWESNNSAVAFYRALGEFWNDEKSIRETDSPIDSGFGQYVNSGANSAIAAITGMHLGERVDVESLIEKTNIEAACAVLAYKLRDDLREDTTGKYNSIIKKVEEFNARNQIETEKRALERHSILKQRYNTIQSAKEEGLLTLREGAEKLDKEIFNLIEQKKNLGSALGSMQASAAFLNALYTAKNAKDIMLTINFGEDYDGAIKRLNELNLSDSRAEIDSSDPKNIKIKTGTRYLQRYAKSIEVTKDIHDENEKIKTDMSNTFEDEDGKVLVKEYNIPIWNDTFINESGEEEKYYNRVEQRNDIEFLNKMGNGLITRVTGAGKTNTSLGFFANKISGDKNFSGIAVVPKGRVKQWVDEAKKFTKLDIVEIPEGISKEERSKIIANIKPNQVAVTCHKDASNSYYDLEAAFSLGVLKGLVLDEPQEIISRSLSSNMSAIMRKLMKLPSENRVALTATPARDNLIEAYDLVNWVSHKDKKLGPRTRFNRIYGGYGSGTNAQDTALQQMIYREISPYISGDRLTNPNFKVNRNEIKVKKSAIQNENMKNIEADANKYIKEKRDSFIQDIESDQSKKSYWENRHGKQWKAQASIFINKKSRDDILEKHSNNLSGIIDNMSWRDNPKISAAIDYINNNQNKKHVIFLDNKAQRRALLEGLISLGYKDRINIKNIASTTLSSPISGAEMAKRVKDFKKDSNVKVIFIDKQSSSGYNLQEGDDLHVLGTPSDAANYLQAQGRIARMPRKGDVTIHTYKYEDDPFDDEKWTKMEQQLAILKATAPGMFQRTEE